MLAIKSCYTVIVVPSLCSGATAQGLQVRNSVGFEFNYYLEVAENMGTIVTTYYFSTCASRVVMATDKSIWLGLTNKVHRVNLLLQSKSILY